MNTLCLVSKPNVQVNVTLGSPIALVHLAPEHHYEAELYMAVAYLDSISNGPWVE